MQYRTMKKTGESLSALGFGCMRLPKKGRSVDEERATRQIRYAIDHGVNYLDTAWMYGQRSVHRTGACRRLPGEGEDRDQAAALPGPEAGGHGQVTGRAAAEPAN